MQKMLLVFAHPDDEFLATAGTIAKYKAAGWGIDILQVPGILDAHPGQAEDTIYKKMEEFVPDVVITMDTTGIDNDPAHVRVCYATTYAFQKYAAWIEKQLKNVEETEQIFPKLYYACMPKSVISYRKKKKELAAESFGKPMTGVEDKKITTIIEGPNDENEYFIFRMHGTTEVFMGKNDHVLNNL